MKTLTFLLSFYIFYGLQLNAQVNLDSLLVAYYPFDGNAVDESGNGNDGTVMGANLVDDRFGNPESAFSFDGFSDYIDLDDVFNDVFVPFAISVWVYKNEAGYANQCILKSDNSTETGTSNYYGFWLTTVDDSELPTVAISYGDGGQPASDHRRTKNTSATLALGEWNHIVINVNGATDISIYFNTMDVGGTYSGTGGPMVHSDWPATIGKNNVPPNVFFNGILDDIRLYERILSSEEIEALYEEIPNPTQQFEYSMNQSSPVKLLQNYPNPFRLSTQIEYVVSEQSNLSLRIYNNLGKLVYFTDNKLHQSGKYKFTFYGTDINGGLLPEGIYYYQIQSDNAIETKQMVICR